MNETKEKMISKKTTGLHCENRMADTLGVSHLSQRSINECLSTSFLEHKDKFLDGGMVKIS